MMMTKRRLVLSAGVAAVALMLSSGARAQSLSDTVRMTVQSNPKILSMQHNRESVDSELRRARSLYLPQVDVRAGIGPEWTENLFSSPGSTQQIRQELSAVLTQKLYDGGATTAEVDHQLSRSRSAAFRVGENSQYVGLDAVEAHLDVIRLRRILAFADQNVHSLNDIVGRVQTRSERGASPTANLAQAMSRYEQAQAERDEVRGSLADAEARYLMVVGQAPGTLEDVQVPVGLLPTDVEASVRVMRASNLTIKAREADVDSAKAAVELADSRFDPSVNLEVGGDHNRNVGGVPGRDNEARAMVVMKWNLYAGGADIHNRESAYAQVAQAKTTRLEAMQKAEEDLRKAWAAYQSASRRVPLLQSAAAHDGEVKTAYGQQFELSQRSLLDLLDAQNAAFQTQSKMATAQGQAIYNGFKILAVEGQLLQALNVAPPPEADPNNPSRKPLRPENM